MMQVPLITPLIQRMHKRLARRVYYLGLPLWDFDFRTPVQQQFPETSAGRAYALGIPTGPDHLWTCEESSGDIIDQIGSLDLAGSGTPYQGQSFYGIGDYVSRKAVEFKEAADKFEAPLTTDLQHNSSTSYAAGCVFRGVGVNGTTRSILGKRVGSSGYWWLSMGATGAVQAVLHDGTTTYSMTVNVDHDDAAPHYAYVVIDRTGSTAYLYTDLGSDSISIAGAASFDDSSAKFAIGRTFNNSPYMQVTDVCYWVGAGAEEVDGTALSAWWVHGSDPTGLLTTQTRGSAITVQVAAGKTATFANDTLPIGYHAALNGGAGGFGLYCNNAVQNLHTDSFRVTGWTSQTNATRADFQANGPSGMRTAGSITATSANGMAYEDNIPTDSTTYTYSLWVRRNGASDVSAQIQLYDVANATTMGTTNFTATDTWQLIKVTGTTGTATNFVRSICRVIASGESVFVDEAQVNVGTGRGAHIRTNGAAASLVAHDFISTAKVPTDKGRIQVEWARTLDNGAVANIINCYTGAVASNLNRRAVIVDASDQRQGKTHNATGTAVLNVTGAATSLDTLYSSVLRWNKDAGFPEDATYTGTYHVDGASVGNTAGALTSSGTNADINIGHYNSASAWVDGVVERIRIYDEVGGVPT